MWFGDFAINAIVNYQFIRILHRMIDQSLEDVYLCLLVCVYASEHITPH